MGTLLIPICQMEKVRHKGTGMWSIHRASLCGANQQGSHPNPSTRLPADGGKEQELGGAEEQDSLGMKGGWARQ